jgi:bifunctional non-homologous end joining protein LigD
MLEEYNAKRDFTVTSEPSGEIPLAFVIQHHLSRREHYDLRLEWRGVLLSWAVPKGPSTDPRDRRLAVHVEDHPLQYRHFQGTIPQGQYGAGSVTIWDKGTWTPHDDVDAALEHGKLQFTLHGEKLCGDWKLVRTSDAKNWLLIKDRP